MGRIKSVAIKTLGNDLIAKHGKRFSDNFDTNKKVLREVKPIESKYVRNVLAGYITRRVQILKRREI
ncbi:MAG: 30S ribosomal protein S17e [Candidatus Aenigmarchaeota archaeon]|nr:30S ribosomal protein S17e [Candidatus Aenigmarchaeota archaeon]